MFGHGAGYTDWMCGSGAFFSGPWGMFVGLLFWGLVIFLIIRLALSVFNSRSGTGRSDGGTNSLEILKERYARGEISRDEFDQMKTDVS